jgi:hypothetical protein
VWADAAEKKGVWDEDDQTGEEAQFNGAMERNDFGDNSSDESELSS